MRAAALALPLLVAALPAAGEAPAGPKLVEGDLVSGYADLAPEAEAPALRRYAIVVGNGAYSVATDLPNAVADARLVAGFLRRAGFHVVERHDLDRRGFENLLRQALFEIETDAEVLFYYAGHGFQIGRRNYIVPVDADLSSPTDLAFEAVTLDSLVAILGSRARLQVMVLDSCRDNPFETLSAITGLSSAPQRTETGFSPMAVPVNSLVSFSTAPGAVALDGETGNSPFTAAFVANADATPADQITSVLERVRREVYRATAGRQIPWESSTLVEPFRFARPDAAPAAIRSLRLVEAALAREAPPARPGEPVPEAVLSAPLERRIAIGRALKAFAGGAVTVTAAGEGRLVLVAPDGRVTDHDGAPLAPDALARLAWEPLPFQVPARPRREDHRTRILLTLAAEGAAPRLVALDLLPGECDWLAGDHLDPEGVGITRYPSDLAPLEAKAACAAAAAAEPETGRFHYQLARALVALRDYEAAETALLRARDLGHTRAWHALGALAAARAAITGGRDDGKADEAAFPFYFEGVRRGDPYAYHALGKQLLRFGETPELQAIGFDLLSRALEVGHTFAMNELGAFFLDRSADHYEPERGLRYLEESAARGDIYGYNNLGLVHDRGLGGLTPDPARAAEWYRKAAEGGHPIAPRNLALLLAKGRIGTAPNPAEALAWYDAGLLRGDAVAGANAAWLIVEAKPKGYGLKDAALRAARAATLRNEAAAADARDLLAQMPEREIVAASQVLLGELGEPVVADGRFGPASEAALARVAAGAGEAVPPAALDRLLLLARIAWARSRFRVDLY